MSQETRFAAVTSLFRELPAILTTPITLPKLSNLTLPSSVTGEKQRQRKNTNPASLNLEGVIQPGHETPFSIGGKDFIVDEQTWVVGDIEIGAFARVKCSANKGGAKVAKSIVMKETTDNLSQRH